MVEIKISLSEKTNKLIQEISDEIGIKRSEFVKSLVIENLEKMRLNKKK